MSQSHPVEPGPKVDLSTSAKGILQSISEGIRTIIVLDEKLALLGKEGDRTRSEVRTVVENLSRVLGKIEEMDKRVAERFAELDKRLAEVDKRIDMKIELAVRDRLEKANA